MKNTILACLGILALLFSSCATTEEIWINKDGSIHVEVHNDMSAFLGLLSPEDLAGGKKTNPDSPLYEDEENPKSESAKKFSEGMAKLFEQERVDTTIDFLGVFQEEMESRGISSEEDMWQVMLEEESEGRTLEERKEVVEFFKGVLKTKMRMQFDREAGTYLISMIRDYANAEEIEQNMNFVEFISTMSGTMENRDPKDIEMARMMMGNAPAYSLTKKEFHLTRKGSDYAEADQETMQQMKMMSAFMGGMNHKYIIHVPKKVKKINIPGAVIKGNTVTFSAPSSQIGEEQADFNVKIKYK
ncbi:MAG: hypothetical protein KTR30_17885 [Saprospiraceae bacterium]|nr:hypothetical protein [Saprospiraceae bacterium]